MLSIVRGWSSDMRRLRESLGRAGGETHAADLGRSRPHGGLAIGTKLQRKLRHSSLLVFPGVGHIPFEEMPDACNGAVRDWLSGRGVLELRRSFQTKVLCNHRRRASCIWLSFAPGRAGRSLEEVFRAFDPYDLLRVRGLSRAWVRTAPWGRTDLPFR